MKKQNMGSEVQRFNVSVYRVLQMRGGGYADVLPVLQVPDNKADAVPCERLLMMIGLAGLDSTGPVDLLYQDESCHVVCKGHWGEG